MTRQLWKVGAFVLIVFGLYAETVRIPVRSAVQPWKNGPWKAIDLTEEIDARRTAIVLCDMWDKHWCKGATNRVAELAPRLSEVVDELRKKGVLVIHAPSETMDFYKDAPQRKAIQALPAVTPPIALSLPDPPLPIDDTKGGCDTPDTFYKAWTREHPAIHIAPEDYISDQGSEIYNALMARGIKQLLVAGVHTNMCVLNRTFAIKQMTRWGVRCILLRDLTDSMYNPADSPHVAHDAGTALVIEHIEKFWCPSMRSGDLLRALAAKP